jgi:hypothetical protein
VLRARRDVNPSKKVEKSTPSSSKATLVFKSLNETSESGEQNDQAQVRKKFLAMS